MVCFVHDRQFLSQFHAAVNKLRLMKLFTTTTLQQLPKQCCLCPEKQTGAEPLLTSLDIDALKLICLRLDLQRRISINVSTSLSSSKAVDYIIFTDSYFIQTRKNKPF